MQWRILCMYVFMYVFSRFFLYFFVPYIMCGIYRRKFFKRREKWKEIMEEKVRSCILLSYFPLPFSAPSASLSFRTTIEEILNRWYWHNFSLFSTDAQIPPLQIHMKNKRTSFFLFFKTLLSYVWVHRYNKLLKEFVSWIKRKEKERREKVDYYYYLTFGTHPHERRN